VHELDRVALTTPLPRHGLQVGDVGAVVDVYANGEGFEVEFCSLRGETIAVVTLPAGSVRPLTGTDVPNARTRTPSEPFPAPGGATGHAKTTRRENLSQAILRLNWPRAMSVEEIVEALGEKLLPWSPTDLRKRVAALLAKESGTSGRFERTGRGVYRRR